MSTSSIIQTTGHTEEEFEHLAENSEGLKKEGLSIVIEAKWWGFIIQLNTSVNGLDRCLTYLEEEFGHHFKKNQKYVEPSHFISSGSKLVSHRQ